MKLPNRESAVISRSKLTSYLLLVSHPYGKHKAAFFRQFGLSVDSPDVIATALLRHADDNEVASFEDSPFGRSYTVEGELRAPDGRAPVVRVVWFIERGEESPHLAQLIWARC